jgi:hypothetical protein
LWVVCGGALVFAARRYQQDPIQSFLDRRIISAISGLRPVVEGEQAQAIASCQAAWGEETALLVIQHVLNDQHEILVYMDSAQETSRAGDFIVIGL